MFFKVNRKKILTVDDTFAMLKNITDDYLNFIFSYQISQLNVLKRNTFFVRTTVLTKNVSPIERKFSTFVKNIQNHTIDAKNLNSGYHLNIIFQNISDITSKISNTFLQKTDTNIVLNQVSVLKSHNSELPVLSSTSEENVYSTRREVSYELLQMGIDPSNVVSVPKRNLTISDAKNGFGLTTFQQQQLRQLQNIDTKPNDTIAYTVTSTNNLDDTEIVGTLLTSPTDILTLEVPVSLPIKNISNNTHFIVKFELLDLNGASIDVINKELDVTNLQRLYFTPKKAPIVNYCNSTLEIVPTNDIFSIKLYKKIIDSTILQEQFYELIGTFNLNSILRLTIDNNLSTLTTYRVIPIGKFGAISHDFANIVLAPNCQTYNTTLNVLLVSNGIQLQFLNFSPQIISVEFLVRNLTIFEKEFRTVDNDIHDVSVTTLVDNNVFSGNVYEYAVRVVNKSGYFSIVNNTIIEYIKPQIGIVDTIISNTITQNTTELDVSFDIQTNIVQSDATITKTLLEKAGITQYDTNILLQRDLLDNLISNNVQRVDLSTGVRTDFGVLSETHFSDSDLRKKNAIQALQVGHKYRYEVTALLRSPETLFSDLRKFSQDNITKKTFTFNPEKFNNPFTLQNGTIASTSGIETRYAKSQMALGAVGNVVTFDVSFDNNNVDIANVHAKKYSKQTNVVTWTIVGDVRYIDHFIIMTKIVQLKKVVGRVHALFENNNCQFIHELSDDDIGSVEYIVLPIFNDYNVGSEHSSNALLVEET